MECFEHGLIGPADTDGIELRFGNAEAMLAVVEQDRPPRGFRRPPGRGCPPGGRGRSAARPRPGDARQGPGAADARSAGQGGRRPWLRHQRGRRRPPRRIPRRHLHRPCLARLPLGDSAWRGRAVRPAGAQRGQGPGTGSWASHWTSCEKSIGFCYFGPSPRSFIPVEDVVAAVSAASGWEVTVAELLEIGERATNLARLFNAREGFSRADDRLPPRLCSSRSRTARWPARRSTGRRSRAR